MRFIYQKLDMHTRTRSPYNNAYFASIAPWPYDLVSNTNASIMVLSSSSRVQLYMTKRDFALAIPYFYTKISK